MAIKDNSECAVCHGNHEFICLDCHGQLHTYGGDDELLACTECGTAHYLGKDRVWRSSSTYCISGTRVSPNLLDPVRQVS